MAITISGTTLTFNDSTTQTTAAGVVSYLAVGTIALLGWNSTTTPMPGNTISGSYLYRQTAGTAPQNMNPINTDMPFNGVVAGGTSTTYTMYYSGGGGTVTNTSGTWRLLNAQMPRASSNLYDGYSQPVLTYVYPALMYRIS